jgi:hypothetical protein
LKLQHKHHVAMTKEAIYRRSEIPWFLAGHAE